MDEYNKRIMEDVVNLKPVFWINPHKKSYADISEKLSIKYKDMMDADNRLRRFAPLIMKLFPETGDGIIESDLVEIPSMKSGIEREFGSKINGELFLKCDSHLKIAGSVKARGGIYEVLKYAEDLALSSGSLSYRDDYSKIVRNEFKNLYSNYKIVVGSTGNLGLSVGIMGTALGFNVTVHMSCDAKQWKKDLLRSRGVEVIEHMEDYSGAVEAGRKQCEGNSHMHFVDDENSRDLFLGYSVAALRLSKHLHDSGIRIDSENELYVYIPCGVGGAAGGIMFGLKSIFGDNVHCFFAEPVHSSCMLLGILTGRYGNMHVKEYGIDNITEADGLAVGSPSSLVSPIAEDLVDGIYTMDDSDLFRFLALLKDTEDIKIEPSAAAGLIGPMLVNASEKTVHISWATGGLLLPDNIFSSMYENGKGKLKHI